MKQNKVLKNELYLLTLSSVIIIIYFLPYFIYGENSKIEIFDNLDANVPYKNIFLENGGVWAPLDTQIEQLLNGVPISAINERYDFSLLGFILGGNYWGLVINKILLCTFGFIGMYLLLRKYFLPITEPFIIISTSLCFSLLPFWSFSLTVAGIPLTLFAFLNIRNDENSWSNWLLMCFFAFCSSLILSGIFVVITFIFILVYDFFRYRILRIKPFLALLLLCISYLISHIPLFYSFLFQNEMMSSRHEYKFGYLSLKAALNDFIKVLFIGQEHAKSLHFIFIAPIFYVTIDQIRRSKTNRFHTYILGYIIVTSLVLAILHWEVSNKILNPILITVPIQLDRFNYLHPILWHLLFGMSLYHIQISFNKGTRMVYFLILIQLLFVFSNHEFITQREKPTYSQFFSKKQFNQIKHFINKPQSSYRVISIGLHPCIAQYNGFYTLDAYLNYYPLEYKHTFRKIIKDELHKDQELKTYYDDWGSRCYAFSSELGRNFLDPKPNPIQKLDYNYDALKAIGGKYIISSAEINTELNQKIKRVSIFHNTNDYWTIHLYEIL
jgi:hypothetical protein